MPWELNRIAPYTQLIEQKNLFGVYPPGTKLPPVGISRRRPR